MKKNVTYGGRIETSFAAELDRLRLEAGWSRSDVVRESLKVFLPELRERAAYESSRKKATRPNNKSDKGGNRSGNTGHASAIP